MIKYKQYGIIEGYLTLKSPLERSRMRKKNRKYRQTLFKEPEKDQE